MPSTDIIRRSILSASYTTRSGYSADNLQLICLTFYQTVFRMITLRGLLLQPAPQHPQIR